jgi:hypothetical protein
MARVFTRKEVDAMIEAAVVRATAPLLERVAALEAELAKAKKNSSNSSKPPSGDLVKPPKAPRKDGQNRKRGGQPGHEQHLRSDFPPEAIDQVVPYTLDCCPDCGGKLRPFERPAEVLQQVEITAAPTMVTEHQGLADWCPRCQALHCAPLPEAVEKAGRFGPRLTALVAFMKGACHASFSTIRKFLRDVIGVTVSRGYLVKLLAGTTRVPDTKHARNLAKRFRKHGAAYFRFVTTPGIEPTNNLAEQAIRFVVIDRRITQGTRSEKGRRWCERIWTVIATCAQQGRAAFQFLLDSVHASLMGAAPPSLPPSGP